MMSISRPPSSCACPSRAAAARALETYFDAKWAAGAPYAAPRARIARGLLAIPGQVGGGAGALLATRASVCAILLDDLGERPLRGRIVRGDHRGQPIGGGRLAHVGLELADHVPVAGIAHAGKQMHVYRGGAAAPSPYSAWKSITSISSQ